MRRSPQAWAERPGAAWRLHDNRRPLAGCLAAGCAIVALTASHGMANPSVAATTTFALTGLAACLCIARGRGEPAEGASWLVLGFGLALWSAGALLGLVHRDPLLANVGMLGFSLSAVVALTLLLRRSPDAWSALPDAAIALLGLATIWSFLMVDRISTTAVDRPDPAAIGYAGLDLIGMALAFALLVRRGWRLDLQVLGLLVGLALIAVGDGALLDPVAGRATADGLAGAFWPAGAIVIGASAWLPRGDITPLRLGEGGLSLTHSAVGAVAALTVLAYDHFDRVSTPTLILALATMVASIAQTVAVHVERDRSAAKLRTEAARTVVALASAVDAKDPYTRHHSDRVARFAAAIGEWLGVAPEQVDRLRVAGELHDVGKIAVPDSLLLKSSPLTPAEYERVKLHSEKGEQLARSAGLPDVAHWIRHHHERWDGRGYPDGIAHDEIPLEARIIAAADAFDAMTSARAYRPALDLEAARGEIASGAGSQFDPLVVQALLAITAPGGRCAFDAPGGDDGGGRPRPRGTCACVARDGVGSLPRGERWPSR